MNQPRMHFPLSRRGLFGVAAGAAAAPMLAGCTGSGDPGQAQSSGGGPDTGEVTWWDQYRPLTDLFEQELFDPFAESHPGVSVKRRELDGPSLGQALQLGRRSKQLPDVHSLAGLDGSPAALVGAGWFQPIDEFVDVESSPVAEFLVDGIHRFDGRVYSVPVFTGRWHGATPWLNTQMFETAGLDPQDQARTWDDYRTTLRELQKGTKDGAYGIVVPTKDAAYVSGLVECLAMSAGAAGGIDHRTGEYAYSSQPYMDAMEFLVSLQADGVVHPASASMDTRDARARWAAGEAAVYMWGSWFIGGLKVQEPQAVERGVNAWHIPAPDGTDPVIYSAPPGGTFWVSSQAKRPKLGAEIMFSMLEEPFMKQLAGAMDQIPIRSELVAEAEVHPAYRDNVEYLAQDVRISPQPQVRNPDVAKALVEMRDITPDLGEIAQSVLTGSLSDYAGALRSYEEKLTAERERAVKAAAGKGAEVSVDDWVFDDWVPGEDYQQ